MAVLRIGSRDSKLAVAQAQEAMSYVSCDCEFITTKTTGDLVHKPFKQINQNNLFVKEIEDMLLCKKIDVAIHSLKDIPVTENPDLAIIAVFPPSLYQDCLVSSMQYKDISSLPSGCRVGTASSRRKAQLLRLRQDIKIINLRGNILTRIAKLNDGGLDAIILAAAGVKRLDLGIGSIISIDEMLPSAGQGVLAAQVRKDDPELADLFARVNHRATWLRIQTERNFMRMMGAGCGDPVACLAIVDDYLNIDAHFMILSEDGSQCYETNKQGTNAIDVARQGAEQLKRYVDIWK